jgi:hypothetical protein
VLRAAPCESALRTHFRRSWRPARGGEFFISRFAPCDALEFDAARPNKQREVLMRLKTWMLLAAVSVFGGTAGAHGPQIQITAEAGKIFTRRVVDDSNYHTALTSPTSTYVMPLAEYLGVWRAQPDGTLLPDSTPQYIGWPGFAYGYGYNPTTNPAPFPVGSNFVLGFTAGLKRWDGAAYADAGATEAEAYRGSSAAPSALARTSDSGPYASLMFPGGAGASFASSGAEVHNTVHYRMLGDGVSPTSPLADGIYLLSMQLGSTDSSLTASAPYYFVLTKNAAPAEVSAAVSALGVAPGAVQYVVPEPLTGGMALAASIGVLVVARRRVAPRRAS